LTPGDPNVITDHIEKEDAMSGRKSGDGVLIGLAALGLGAMTVAIVYGHAADTDAVRFAIRMTARASLAFFLVAFLAGPLLRLMPGRFTAWLVRHRRAFGLSFALSHAIHLTMIGLLYSLDRTLFWTLTNPVTVTTGIIAYGLIAIMTLTSLDALHRAMGPKLWRGVHLLGSWYIWISFAVAFGRRAVMNGHYWFPVAILVVALAVRLLGMVPKPAKLVEA
jgi:methionine sulfoxide reductase heme-binding subunit